MGSTQQQSLVTAFVPFGGNDFTRATVAQLRQAGHVTKTYVLAQQTAGAIDGAETLVVDAPHSWATMKELAARATTPYALLVLHDAALEL